jgi:hypothetical protein
MLAVLLGATLGPYRTVHLHGWTLQVEAALIEQAPLEWHKTRAELDSQLHRTARVVPDGPLAKLRQVTVWVHRAAPWTQCMAYHPGPEFLREHGMNPDMAKGIEVGNARAFVSWTYEQPWMVLHELAHAYHDRFLEGGFENPRVKRAFEAAEGTGKYEQVMRWNGSKVRHYALTNQMEYFAEGTEAYFGQNDFFPFVRPELAQFDPEGLAMLREVWGEPQKRL